MRSRSAWPHQFSITSSSANTDAAVMKAAACSNTKTQDRGLSCSSPPGYGFGIGGLSAHNFDRDRQLFCI